MSTSFKAPQPIFKSQRHAVEGILSIVKNERNFRIQMVIAIIVVTVSFLLNISHTDWIAVGFLITLVLISEAFNSVIEAVCDTVSKEYRVNIKYAKDVSAGAVLLSAILSITLGLIIFLPYIVELLKEYL
jgi:diacylglycerol kinase